jgi:transcriptional regulator with XRE-family HTH domain
VKNPAGLKAFADRLRYLRKQKGLSQKKLADIANIEQTTVARIELVQLAPTLDLLISISRAMELEIYELVHDPAITNSDKEVRGVTPN